MNRLVNILRFLFVFFYSLVSKKNSQVHPSVMTVSPRKLDRRLIRSGFQCGRHRSQSAFCHTMESQGKPHENKAKRKMG